MRSSITDCALYDLFVFFHFGFLSVWWLNLFVVGTNLVLVMVTLFVPLITHSSFNGIKKVLILFPFFFSTFCEFMGCNEIINNEWLWLPFLVSSFAYMFSVLGL